MNPRLGPVITFLSDLHLLGQHGPTPAGRGQFFDVREIRAISKGRFAL